MEILYQMFATSLLVNSDILKASYLKTLYETKTKGDGFIFM